MLRGLCDLDDKWRAVPRRLREGSEDGEEEDDPTTICCGKLIIACSVDGASEGVGMRAVEGILLSSVLISHAICSFISSTVTLASHWISATK